MPKVTTKFSFTVGGLDTKEKLVDVLTAFASYIDSTYAKKEVSVPLDEVDVSADTTIQLNSNSLRLVVIVKATAALTLTLLDNKDNPCSIGTLVELKLKCSHNVNVNLTIPPSTTITDNRTAGYHSRYYFKGNSGWIVLN